MRSSYDAIVIGFGPAACLAAQRLAASGRSVAMIDRKVASTASDWIDHWLVPWRMDDALAACGWNRAAIESLALECVELDFGSGEAVRCALVDVEDFRGRAKDAAREVGVEVSAAVFEDYYLIAGAKTHGVRTTHGALTAPVVVSAQASPSCEVAVWGRYRGVCREPSPSGASALRFQGREGASFWMLPLDDEQTELGVAVRAHSASILSAAQLWEDELVACPALAERMMDATLIESYPLQTFVRRETILPPGVVAIEELECRAVTAFRWSTLSAAIRAVDEIVLGLQAPARAS